MRRLALLLALTACCAACSSGDSSPTGPDSAAPAPVTDLRVTAGEAGAVTLAWTSPHALDGGAVSYELRRIDYAQVGTPFAAWTVITAPGGDPEGGQSREHRVSGLTAGETYAFRLRAAETEGAWSAPSNFAVGTADPDHDRTRPGAVASVRKWAATDTSLTVAWAPAGDDSVFGTAARHEVRWSTAPITAANWDAANPATGPISTASMPGLLQTSIGDLATDDHYYVGVRGIDDAGHLGAVGANLHAQVRSMRTIYVNVDGTGDLPTIHEAVNAATPWRDVVLVGPGRYTWTNQGTGSPKQGLVQVYRGQIGITLASTDGPEATIIDAEGNGPVLRLTGEPATMGLTLDGFTITGGNATGAPDSPNEHDAGGGLIIHLSGSTIRNCIITGNEAIKGGGVWCGGQGEVLFENCVIADNVAEFGGGIFLVNSAPRVTMRNCEIRDNEADYGSGIWSYHILYTLEDCLIAGNRAVRQGGGLWAVNVHPGCELVRTTIVDNVCGRGSAFYVARLTGEDIIPPDEVVLHLDHVLITGNEGSAAFSSSALAGVRIGCSVVWGNPLGDNRPTLYRDDGGNFAADPLFCDRDEYTLAAGSPCLPGNHPEGGDCAHIGARDEGCSAR